MSLFKCVFPTENWMPGQRIRESSGAVHEEVQQEERGETRRSHLWLLCGHFKGTTTCPLGEVTLLLVHARAHMPRGQAVGTGVASTPDG